MTTGTDRGDAQPALRERWRAASLDSIWLRPSDWYHPSVDVLAEAVQAGGDVLEQAEDLGRARADVGVGIGEALDDLACLYRSAGLVAPPAEAVRALAVGWTDAQAGMVVNGGAVDPETGLPTLQYLSVRLGEAYAAADAAPAREVYRLTAVDVAVGEAPGLLRSARSAMVGAALRAVFGAQHPMATLGGGVFVVLTRVDEDVDALLGRLQDEIDLRCGPTHVNRATRNPMRAWHVALPCTHDEAAQVLRRLARPPG